MEKKRRPIKELFRRQKEWLTKHCGCIDIYRELADQPNKKLFLQRKKNLRYYCFFANVRFIAIYIFTFIYNNF